MKMFNIILLSCGMSLCLVNYFLARNNKEDNANGWLCAALFAFGQLISNI